MLVPSRHDGALRASALLLPSFEERDLNRRRTGALREGATNRIETLAPSPRDRRQRSLDRRGAHSHGLVQGRAHRVVPLHLGNERRGQAVAGRHQFDTKSEDVVLDRPSISRADLETEEEEQAAGGAVTGT